MGLKRREDRRREGKGREEQSVEPTAELDTFAPVFNERRPQVEFRLRWENHPMSYNFWSKTWQSASCANPLKKKKKKTERDNGGGTSQW